MCKSLNHFHGSIGALAASELKCSACKILEENKLGLNDKHSWICWCMLWLWRVSYFNYQPICLELYPVLQILQYMNQINTSCHLSSLLPQTETMLTTADYVFLISYSLFIFSSSYSKFWVRQSRESDRYFIYQFWARGCYDMHLLLSFLWDLKEY